MVRKQTWRISSIRKCFVSPISVKRFLSYSPRSKIANFRSKLKNFKGLVNVHKFFMNTLLKLGNKSSVGICLHSDIRSSHQDVTIVAGWKGYCEFLETVGLFLALLANIPLLSLWSDIISLCCDINEHNVTSLVWRLNVDTNTLTVRISS